METLKAEIYPNSNGNQPKSKDLQMIRSGYRRTEIRKCLAECVPLGRSVVKLALTPAGFDQLLHCKQTAVSQRGANVSDDLFSQLAVFNKLVFRLLKLSSCCQKGISLENINMNACISVSEKRLFFWPVSNVGKTPVPQLA